MWPCPPARRVPHLPPSSATGCRSKLSLLHSSRYSTAREPGLPLPFSSTFDSRELQQQKRGRPVWGRVEIFLSNHQQRLQQAGMQAKHRQASAVHQRHNSSSSSRSGASSRQYKQLGSLQRVAVPPLPPVAVPLIQHLVYRLQHSSSTVHRRRAHGACWHQP